MPIENSDFGAYHQYP